MFNRLQFSDVDNLDMNNMLYNTTMIMEDIKEDQEENNQNNETVIQNRQLMEQQQMLQQEDNDNTLDLSASNQAHLMSTQNVALNNEFPNADQV